MLIILMRCTTLSKVLVQFRLLALSVFVREESDSDAFLIPWPWQVLRKENKEIGDQKDDDGIY